ncbi:hypothetical protein [Nocardioides acrostichi]|uniref:AAA+ ATPase domain-containing protein n=1 Tax=Nocardioides acrostichi TaxID=2784339 RepID=A0A930Y6Y8_9ACTN|nr:hypothetical protein [Nocardioides acrostichi]MBF4161451.1 hypothetical protein [Nocardioides acrostichi]
MPRDELFADLRQGARNVAGVRWQTSVCAHLLVASHAGELDFVSLVPEGYEDADCTSRDGARTYVQMKELDAGHGVMHPSGVAEALAHAEASARGARIVLITDGTLSSELTFTGWKDTLGPATRPGVSRIKDGLISSGYSDDEADDILSRSHLLHLPYRLRQDTERLLVQSAAAHPTVGGLTVARLTDEVGRLSGDQRRATSTTAGLLRTSDIDALLVEIQDSVDPAGLHQALTAGVCAPVDFIAPEEIESRVFYLGVDGRPAHIAANLDVRRPVELDACGEGLATERAVILVGPSGAGKSVLLWRAARDLVPGARVLRVLRVQTEEDARDLARHVRLQRPSDHSPVLVVCDDLGRPHVGEWSKAAALVREVPGTLLLGAARAEDFTPALTVGATRIVRPVLIAPVAKDLGERLSTRGVALQMDPLEALGKSEGLMMEFIALLTTGRRLREVLAAQVEQLRDPARRLQREGARLVTTAHLLGLQLDADRLGAQLLANAPRPQAPRGDAPGTERNEPAAAGWDPDESDVGDALSVLRDEHIAVESGSTWRGLHELRSAVISGLLHESPPPTTATTLSRLAPVIDPDHAGWMLRRVAEQFPKDLNEVVTALSQTLLNRGASTATIASFLEGAERADNALYATATLPALEEAKKDSLPITTLAMFIYPMRNQGFGDTGQGGVFDELLPMIRPIADKIPRRVAFDTTLTSACRGLAQDALDELLRNADLVDATRLLEAGREPLNVSKESVRALLARSTAPHDDTTALVWSRLLAVCSIHVSAEELAEVAGDVTQRVRTVCAADPFVLDAEVLHTTPPEEDQDDETEDGTASGNRTGENRLPNSPARSSLSSPGRLTASVTRLLPSETDQVPRLSWDLPPKSDDGLNWSTVSCLERIKDACPEIEQFQIITVTASGARYRLRDFEPGYKNMARAAFPDRFSVRQSVGYQASLRRITSSQTWTEVITAQAAVASDLTAAAQQIPLRLKPADHPKRRAAWQQQLVDIRNRVSAISPPPLPPGTASDTAHAHDDQRDRAADATTRALQTAFEAVFNAAPQDNEATRRALAMAMSLRDAADALDKARDAAQPVVPEVGSVLPEALSTHMRSAADLAAALHVQPTQARHVRADDPSGSAAEIVERVREEASVQGAETLRQVLARVPEATYQLVADPDPASWALQPNSWVIVTPGELLDQTLEALGTLDDAAREVLGPHTVVIPIAIAEDRADDHDTQVTSVISLDMGFQLSSTSTREPLQITPDAVRAWAIAAGVRAFGGTSSHLDAASKLVEQSQEAARRRMRRLPDPGTGTVTSMGAPSPERPPVAVGPGADHNPDSPDGALALLKAQVKAEEAGTTTTYLAEVVLRATTGVPHDDESMRLIELLSVLHFDRLQSQVQEATAAQAAAAQTAITLTSTESTNTADLPV